MPNGMEHIDWGFEASGKAHDLEQKFEAHCQFMSGWREGIQHRLERIEDDLATLKTTEPKADNHQIIRDCFGEKVYQAYVMWKQGGIPGETFSRIFKAETGKKI